MILNFDLINLIEKINSTEIMTIIAFMGSVSFVVGVILLGINKTKVVLKHILAQSIARDILISIVLIIFGLVSPLYLILKSFSDWSGWELWLTQILSWYVIFSFIVLTFIIINFYRILNQKE